MSRLIDADKVVFNITHDFDDEGNATPSSDEELTQKCLSINDVVGWLKVAPTVDAEPIRHGHWVRTNKTDKFAWECSECGYGLTDYKLSYCYDCGAKMGVATE